MVTPSSYSHHPNAQLSQLRLCSCSRYQGGCSIAPLFEAAISKTPELNLGSPYALAIELLVGELPILVLSALCILLGIFVVAVALCFRFVIKTDNKEIIYLGFFSIAVGVWKLTDLRCISLLMPEHSLSLCMQCFIKCQHAHFVGLCFGREFGCFGFVRIFSRFGT